MPPTGHISGVRSAERRPSRPLPGGGRCGDDLQRVLPAAVRDLPGRGQIPVPRAL